MGKFLGTAAFVLLLGILAACDGSGVSSSPGPPSPTPTASGSPLTLSFKGDPRNPPNCVTVDQQVAFADKNSSVTFSPSPVPTGYEVEIDFLVGDGYSNSGALENVKGPFPPGSAKARRGRYVLQQSSVTTKPADHSGYWKYQMVLLDTNGLAVGGCVDQDPGLIIKN